MNKIILTVFASTFALASTAFFQSVESLKYYNKCVGGHLPFDANRVRLNSNTFINASYLVEGGTSFVIALMPDSSSDPAFWELLEQENVRVFISLEKGTWFNRGETRIVGDSVIRCLDERVNPDGLIKRYYAISNGQQKRGIIQLELASLSNNMLKAAFKKTQSLNSEGRPIVLQSETGIEPAGRFVSAATMKERNLHSITAQRFGLLSKAK